MTEANQWAKSFVLKYGGEFLDSDSILWKIVDGEWIGKKAVQMKDLSIRWPEDINHDDIKKWL